eukprot:gene22173-biopygen1893
MLRQTEAEGFDGGGGGGLGKKVRALPSGSHLAFETASLGLRQPEELMTVGHTILLTSDSTKPMSSCRTSCCFPGGTNETKVESRLTLEQLAEAERQLGAPFAPDVSRGPTARVLGVLRGLGGVHRHFRDILLPTP